MHIVRLFCKYQSSGHTGTGESASLKDSVEQQKQHEQLEKQVAALEAKIRKEKQPKKKFELVQQMKALQKKTETL